MSDSEKNPVYKLAEQADSLFARAAALDDAALCKKDPEGSAYLSELRIESYRQCIELWTVILDLLPASPVLHPEKKSLSKDAFKVISRCYQRLDELEPARKYIAKAIDEGYPAGFISLGAICMKLEDYDAAQDAFESAISKNIMESRAHAGLGELFFILGTRELKKNPKHTDYFKRSEEEFIAAGKERFTDSFERAIELFDMVGLKDRAISVGQSAVGFYDQNRNKYGEKLKSLDARIRRITGDEKHDKLVKDIGRKISKILDKKD